MYHFQLFTVLLAIGLSSQSVLKMVKFTGLPEDICPAKVPVISTACNLYGSEHGTELSTCLNKTVTEIVTKVELEDDKGVIKKIICD